MYLLGNIQAHVHSHKHTDSLIPQTVTWFCKGATLKPAELSLPGVTVGVGKMRSPGGISSFQWITLACVLQLYQGCTQELFFVRPFHLDHFVFWTSEALLCAPRISSTESHMEQQWHANPGALNGLACGSDNSRGRREWEETSKGASRCRLRRGRGQLQN